MTQATTPMTLFPAYIYRTRYLLRRDRKAVLSIDAASFEHPWDAAEYRRLFRDHTLNGRIALVDERVAGYFAYRLSHRHVHIERFAVAPGFRRSGIGRRMARGLVERFVMTLEVRLTLDVREHNDAGIAFWQSCGFRAMGVQREHYPDGSDAYRFEYVNPEPECSGR